MNSWFAIGNGGNGNDMAEKQTVPASFRAPQVIVQRLCGAAEAPPAAMPAPAAAAAPAVPAAPVATAMPPEASAPVEDSKEEEEEVQVEVLAST